MDVKPASATRDAKRNGDGLVLYKKGNEIWIAFLSVTTKCYLTKSRWLKNRGIVGEFYAMIYAVNECGKYISISKAEKCSTKKVSSRVVNGRAQILISVCKSSGILTTPFGKIDGIDRKTLKFIDQHGIIMAWCSLDSVSHRFRFIEASCQSELQKPAAVVKQPQTQPLLQSQKAAVKTTMPVVQAAMSKVLKSEGIVLCRESEKKVMIALLDATSTNSKIKCYSTNFKFLFNNGKIGDLYTFYYRMCGADGREIRVNSATPIVAPEPPIKTRVVNQTPEVLVNVFHLDDVYLSSYGPVTEIDDLTVRSVIAKQNVVKAWCTIDTSEWRLCFTELCETEMSTQASLASSTALSVLPLGMSTSKMVALGLLLSKKGNEAVLALLREPPATTKCAMTKWKFFPKGGVVGQYYSITYCETRAGNHIRMCAAVPANGEFPVTRVVDSRAQILTSAFKKGQDFMTTYGRMDTIENDSAVMSIVKCGTAKVWCDIHPTTNLFCVKQLEYDNLSGDFAQSSINSCTSKTFKLPDKVSNTQKVSNSLTQPLLKSASSSMSNDSVNPAAVIGPPDLSKCKISTLAEVAYSPTTSIVASMTPSPSLSTLSSCTATTSATDAHSAAVTNANKSFRNAKWSTENYMAQALVIGKVGFEIILLVIDAVGKKLRKYYAVITNRSMFNVQIGKWCQVTFHRSAKSQQHIWVIGVEKMDFDVLPTMMVNEIVAFLIPVSWSSKKGHISSKCGIIDASDDNTTYIRQVAGSVNAWCVALKGNIFKLLHIGKESEQLNQSPSPSLSTLSSCTTTITSTATTDVKNSSVRKKNSSKWSVENYSAQALIIGANKYETFLLAVDGDSNDKRMTRYCTRTTENTPLDVLIGEWHFLKFKHSSKSKGTHIPHILVIDIQRSALNVPATRIVDNEVCFLVPVFWSSEKGCFSCQYGDFTDASADNAAYLKRVGRPVDAWCISTWKGTNALSILHIYEDSEQFKQNVEEWGCVRVNAKTLYSDRLVDARGLVVAVKPQPVFTQVVNGVTSSHEKEVGFYVCSTEIERLMILTDAEDGPVGVGDWLHFKMIPNTVTIVQYSRCAAAENPYLTLRCRDRVYVQCDVDVPVTYRPVSLERVVFKNVFSACVVDARGLITSYLAGTTLTVVVGSGSMDSYCFCWVIEAIRKIVKVNRPPPIPQPKGRRTATRKSYTRKQILSLFKCSDDRVPIIDPIAKLLVRRRWYEAANEYRKWICAITN